MTHRDQTVVVTGVTGRQGGAVARSLLADGWRVRGVTRRPDSPAARQVAGSGAQVVAADMSDPRRMLEVCSGAYGVFSVQNPMTAGEEGELVQARNVVDAAAAAGVEHLVYGSAGPGAPGTGVASWDGKVHVAEYARSRGVPLTVLRPMAFMELMTDKDLYPAVATWHLMGKMVGEQRPLLWLSAQDLGSIAARAFSEPNSYIGADLPLAADLRSLAECRALWHRLTGRSPRRFPMPLWLFQRIVGPDLVRMWRWLASHDVDVKPDTARRHHPSAVSVEDFIRQRTERP